jgi:hypothetical protein
LLSVFFLGVSLIKITGGLPAGLPAEGMVGKEIFREQNILQLVLIDLFFGRIKRQTKFIRE